MKHVPLCINIFILKIISSRMKWNIRLKDYYLVKKANKIDPYVQKYEKKSRNASQPKSKEVRSVVSVRINVSELLHPLI